MRNELGQFVKGHTVKESWRKSLSERLKENNPGFKKGETSWNKGRKFTEEHKIKISESQKLEKGYWFGKKASEETRQKLSNTHSGKNHWNYKDGNKSGIRTQNYKWHQIRKEVYKRDNYTCQACGIKNPKILNCHHKIPYDICNDNEMTNLITLCSSCHTKEENKLHDNKSWRYIKNKEKQKCC